MKKIAYYFFFFITIFFLTACSTTEKMQNKYLPTTDYDDTHIAINPEEITTTATFYNYEVDGITIQLIAVRGTDGRIRVVFNTCQSCSPSPDAYFIQEGEYFICQNCQTKIHVDKLDDSSFGCSPVRIEGEEDINGLIVISKEKIEEAKERFKTWQGITSA